MPGLLDLDAESSPQHPFGKLEHAKWTMTAPQSRRASTRGV